MNTFLTALLLSVFISCAPTPNKSDVAISHDAAELSPLDNLIEEKLHHIFLYQVVAYKNAHSVWKVEAVKNQVDIIKRELKFALAESFSTMNENKRIKVRQLVIKFSQRSSIHSYQLSKIFSQEELNDLGIKITINSIQPDDIKAAIRKVSNLHIFKVYEKNIEHLSYISETKHRPSEKS